MCDSSINICLPSETNKDSKGSAVTMDLNEIPIPQKTENASKSVTPSLDEPNIPKDKSDISEINNKNDIDENEKSANDALLDILKNQPQFTCERCDFVCNKLIKLKKHKSYIHDNPIVKLYCDQCKFVANNNIVMGKHKAAHDSGVKFISCDKCSFVTPMEHLYKRHLAVHLDTPQKCPDCDYTYTRMDRYYSHRRIHTGEKPFSCEECDFTCRTPNGLRNHRKRHYFSRLSENKHYKSEYHKFLEEY